MNLNTLKDKTGLTAIGIANAEGLDEEYKRLLDWFAKGYHANMMWLPKSAKKRCEPSYVLPEPATVIVCAMKYEDMPPRTSLRDESRSNPPHNTDQTGSPRPFGARDDNGTPEYLRHQDYHIVMMEKLESVAQTLKEEHPDIKYKCYVDTGPVLEKAWAARAGLGFIGKNTLLISPEHGSQLALGAILTNVDLKPDARCQKLENPASGLLPPALDCGSCTACLDACPTKALIAPYILDARKCISYKFFAEKKEGGCDICQDVCPFNKPKQYAQKTA